MGVAAIAVVAKAISKQPVHLGGISSGAPSRRPNPSPYRRGTRGGQNGMGLL